MKKIFFVLTTFIFVMLSGLEVNAAYDVTAPKLKGVTLDKTTVTKPGILNITLDIVEDETGVTRIEVLYMKPGATGDDFLVVVDIPNVYTGKYTVSAPISSSFKVGNNFYISEVRLYDAQGNESWYADFENIGKLRLWNWRTDHSFNEDDYCYVNHGFAVEEEFDVDFQYNITNPNIISKIKNMGNDEVGMVTYDTQNHVANKAIFDAIKGTNKTIVFSNDSMQWVFNGNDLSGEIKNIDLNIDVSKANGTEYNNKEDVLKIDFADNGILPGNARVRLKADYMYTLHNLSDTLFLYYLDQKNSTIEKINSSVNYILDGNDHWCQFYVNHNSSYIISSETAQYIPKRGATVNDTKAKATYKVTKSGKSNGTVEYCKSTNSKAKTIKVPATVTINGINYKVTSIANNAFKNNKTVTKIVIGKNVKTIGSSAFSGCNKLKTVSIGANVTKIGSNAFYKCIKLTKITIPAKMTTIGKQAFSGCKKLKTITIKSKKLKSVGKNAFKGISSKAKIKVPSSKLKKYKQLLKKKGQKSTAKITK